MSVLIKAWAYYLLDISNICVSKILNGLIFCKKLFRDDIHPCVCTLCRKPACYHKLVGLFIVKGAYTLGVDLLQPFHYHLCTFFLCHRYCSFVYKCFITLYCTLFCRIRQPKFHIRDDIPAGLCVIQA
jgi:hypothetical protein